MLITGTGLNRDAFIVTLDGHWIPKSMIAGRTRDGSYICTNGIIVKE